MKRKTRRSISRSNIAQTLASRRNANREIIDVDHLIQVRYLPYVRAEDVLGRVGIVPALWLWLSSEPLPLTPPRSILCRVGDGFTGHRTVVFRP